MTYKVLLTDEQLNVIRLSLQYSLHMYYETDQGSITENGRQKMEIAEHLLKQLPGRPPNVTQTKVVANSGPADSSRTQRTPPKRANRRKTVG